jgi:hypothetical protein
VCLRLFCAFIWWFGGRSPNGSRSSGSRDGCLKALRAQAFYDEPATCATSSNRARLLAFVTGLVNQELLLRNEYLAAENRILRYYFRARLRLCDAERCTLAEIGKRLGRKGLKPVA